MTEQSFRTSKWDEFHRLNQDQRLHLHPTVRLFTIFSISSTYGFFNNARIKHKETGLRFLAENSHRLPTTKKGWYFYHKRKNYVCLKDSIKTGVFKGIKIGTLVTSYFGLEALLDEFRGKIDFMNTMVATVISGGFIAKYNHLGRQSTVKMIKNCAVFGLVSGLLQDLLFYKRNGTIWYINGIQNEGIFT